MYKVFRGRICRPCSETGNKLATLYHLSHQLTIIIIINIEITFGLDKCAKVVCIKRGKYVESTNINLEPDIEIKQSEDSKTYNYLGIDERNGIEHVKMKKDGEYISRIRNILKTELIARNKLRAITN